MREGDDGSRRQDNELLPGTRGQDIGFRAWGLTYIPSKVFLLVQRRETKQ